MLRLYDFLSSGNGYKVRLLLTQLSIAFERIEVDIRKGETRTAEFLTKNPNGRIPVLEIETVSFCLNQMPFFFTLVKIQIFFLMRRASRLK